MFNLLATKRQLLVNSKPNMHTLDFWAPLIGHYVLLNTIMVRHLLICLKLSVVRPLSGALHSSSKAPHHTYGSPLGLGKADHSSLADSDCEI